MLGMSGIGVYLENLVPLIVKECSTYRFRLIGCPEKIRQLPLPAEDRIAIHPCRAPIYSVREQWLMPLAAHEANLLWVPHYNIPLLTTVPLMVTVHDVAHLVLPEVRRNKFRLAYARLFFEAVRRKAKTILTVSQFTADEFVRHAGKPKGELRVVHNGVDAAWFEAPIPDKQTQRQGAPPYFIAVGNLKVHKRIDLLCRAFAAVKDSIPHHLVLVGKHEGFISGGQSMQDLLELAPGRITCTGPVDTPRLRELVRDATALVFPSSYEGFGLPPLEAMAAGVPIIAADIPPVREVCGEWVRYFSVGGEELSVSLKAMAAERGEPSHLVWQIIAAQNQAAQFTWHRAATVVAEAISLTCPQVAPSCSGGRATKPDR